MANELNIHPIPVVLLIITLVTFTVTYVWSVGNGHVVAVFPSISDTGAFPPESCLFAEMANIAAVLMILTVYFRFLILRDFANVKNLKSFSVLIEINVVVGMVVSLGVSFVGNYQTVTIAPLHYLGAFLLFGLGEIYVIIDVVLCYRTAIFPRQSRVMCHFRAFLAAFVAVVIVIMVTFGAISSTSRVGRLDDPKLRLIWRPEDGGYSAHVVSNVCEWVIGMAELVYFATFTDEFRKFRLPFPRLRPVDPGSTLRASRGGTPASLSRGDSEERETEPLLQTRSKQFLYIGTGDVA